MSKSQFKVGDKVRIVANEIQSHTVGQVAHIKKVYPTFSDEDDWKYVYRLELNGVALKGVATANDLEPVK